MKILIRKFQRNLRDYGPGVACRKAISRVFRFVYEAKVYRIYVMDLRKYAAKPRSDGIFSFRLIDAGDTDCVRQIEGMEEWLEGETANYLGERGLILVAMDGGAVAGFNMVALGEVYMPLVRARRVFRPGEAWSVQITVGKKYRGKGLGSELRYRMFDELKRRGFRKFYGGTLSDNQANLQLTRKVGFREIADIRYRSLFSSDRREIRRIA